MPGAPYYAEAFSPLPGLPQQLLGVGLVLVAITAGALRARPSRQVGRRLAPWAVLVLGVLAILLWYDWTQQGANAVISTLLAKTWLALGIVLIGWWVARGGHRPGQGGTAPAPPLLADRRGRPRCPRGRNHHPLADMGIKARWCPMSGLLWAVLGSLGAALLFLRPLLVPLLTKDLEEGVPWFAAWLVRRAARKLPAKQRERFEEEWLAELTAVPGVMVFKLTFAVGVSSRARSTSRAVQGLPPWWEQILRRLAQTMAGALRFNAEAARVLFGNPHDLPTTKVQAVSISLLQLVRVALHEAYSIVKEAMLFLLEAYRSRSRRRRSKASFIQVKTLNSGIFIGDSSQKPPLVQRFDPDWQLAPLTLDDPGIDDDGAIKRLPRWHEELPADGD